MEHRPDATEDPERIVLRAARERLAESAPAEAGSEDWLFLVLCLDALDTEDRVSKRGLEEILEGSLSPALDRLGATGRNPIDPSALRNTARGLSRRLLGLKETTFHTDWISKKLNTFLRGVSTGRDWDLIASRASPSKGKRRGAAEFALGRRSRMLSSLKDVKPEIEYPADGSTVLRVESLVGVVPEGLWPVVLIRPMIEGSPWWVQPSIRETSASDGVFACEPIYFGEDSSETTPPGSRFQVVIVAFPSRERALAVREGDQLGAIPLGASFSRTIVVSRG